MRWGIEQAWLWWANRQHDCNVAGHRWGTWRRIGVLFQQRHCRVCGWEESASIPIDGRI